MHAIPNPAVALQKREPMSGPKKIWITSFLFRMVNQPFAAPVLFRKMTCLNTWGVWMSIDLILDGTLKFCRKN